MRVERRHMVDSSTKNAGYNAKLRPLAALVTQAERPGRLGYVQTDESAFHEGRHRSVYGSSREITDPELAAQQVGEPTQGQADLGPVERALIHVIRSPAHTTTVVHGPLGSGKTALTEFVFHHLSTSSVHSSDPGCQSCRLRRFVPLELRFTRGYGGGDAASVVSEFEEELFNRLEGLLAPILEEDGLLGLFLERARHRSADDWANFFAFVSEVVQDIGEGWDKKTASQKVDRLLRWIRDLASTPHMKIKRLCYLLNLVFEFSGSQPGCIAMLFDNIDRLQPDNAQNQVLMEIFSFAEVARVKTVVTMRNTAYGWIGADASYEFEPFQHAGNPPIRIIAARLRDYLEHRTDPEFKRVSQNVSDDYLRAFDCRADVILQNLTSQTRLADVLGALSGSSIRRGLNLARRLFVNSVIPWDEEAPAPAELVRALFVGTNATGVLSSADEHLMNLFVSPHTGHASLLPIRVLQLLQGAKQRFERPLSGQEIAGHLRSMGHTLPEELWATVNGLIGPRRRLVWVDCVSRYPDPAEFVRSYRDQVSISFTGESYLSRICCELAYLQEAFVPIEWPPDSVTRVMDVRSRAQRFSLVRTGLKVLMFNDWRELRPYFERWPNGTRLVDELITHRILRAAAEAIVRIVERGGAQPGEQEELVLWWELLAQAQFASTAFFRAPDPDLATLLSEYSRIAGISGADGTRIAATSAAAVQAVLQPGKPMFP